VRKPHNRGSLHRESEQSAKSKGPQRGVLWLEGVVGGGSLRGGASLGWRHWAWGMGKGL
jgi:hypothetical protein